MAQNSKNWKARGDAWSADRPADAGGEISAMPANESAGIDTWRPLQRALAYSGAPEKIRTSDLCDCPRIGDTAAMISWIVIILKNTQVAGETTMRFGVRHDLSQTLR
jgi:hypothetical protein